MANPLRGEAKLGDKTLVFDVNALCSLEDALDSDLHQIIAKLQRGGGVRMLRAIVWAGMLSHAPDATLADAADLIGTAGMDEAAEAVTIGFSRALPSAGGKAKPPRARAARATAAGAGKSS